MRRLIEKVKPMNCVLYLRVSSEEQVTNYSLDNQEKICREAAVRLGYKVLDVFREEGESAKTADRTELIKLLNYCRENKSRITSVLAYKIDRIARETSDYLAIRKKLAEYAIKLESATEPTGNTPVEKFVETLLAANAQLDNEIRGERAKNGLYSRFRAGLSNRPHLGYRTSPNGKRSPVEPHPKMFPLVKQGWELMGTGTKSLSEMAALMNSWGVRHYYNKKNHLLTKQSVGKMFRNKFYCGWLTSEAYPDEEIRGQHEQMISETLFYRVQGFLDGRRTSPADIKHRVHNPDFPLRGIVKCDCGAVLVGGNCKGRNAYYPKYWCRNPEHKAPTISVEQMQIKLDEWLAKIQPTEDAINMFSLIIHKDYNKKLDRIKKLKLQADKKIIEHKQTMTLLVQNHMKGLYPDDIYKEEKVKIEDKILSCQIVRNDSLCNQYDIEEIINFIKALLHDLVKAYDVSDYGQKRVLIGSIFPSGLVLKQGELLNPEVSLMFNQIEAASKEGVLLSAGDRT